MRDTNNQQQRFQTKTKKKQLVPTRNVTTPIFTNKYHYNLTHYNHYNFTNNILHILNSSSILQRNVVGKVNSELFIRLLKRKRKRTHHQNCFLILQVEEERFPFSSSSTKRLETGRRCGTETDQRSFRLLIRFKSTTRCSGGLNDLIYINIYIKATVALNLTHTKWTTQQLNK